MCNLYLTHLQKRLLSVFSELHSSSFERVDLGRLAQLVRASRLHREGRGFESLIAHQFSADSLCESVFLLQLDSQNQTQKRASKQDLSFL